MTTRYTKYYRFNLPDFRMGPWHDLINEDIIRIDELLYGIDSGGGVLSAVDILFDGTITNLPAVNVQEAIDYLHTYVKNIDTTIDSIQDTVNNLQTYIDTVWAAARKVPVAFPFVGKPPANIVINTPIAMPVTIQANLAGTAVYSGIQATANTTFDVNKISGGVTTLLGQVMITSVSHTSYVLGGLGGTLNPGDVLQVATPTQDATLADVGITILTLRV